MKMHVTKLLQVFGVVTLMGGLFLMACASSARMPAAAPVRAREQGSKGAEEHKYAAGLPDLSAVDLGEGEKLLVLATTNIVADVVLNVGGDEIKLIGLLPVGAEPHSYEPTPRDLHTVADAHVVFANGAGLEEFLDEMLEHVGTHVSIIPVSHGVKLRELEDQDERAPENAASEPDHRHTTDPHTWFDPNNIIIWTENIAHTLSALDPAHTNVFTANAEAYIKQLKDLDVWVHEQVSQIPVARRKLVTDHTVLGYFADKYGFEQVGAVIESFSIVAEPSAQELAGLENAIRQYSVPAIFVGTTVNPKLSEQVARDTGIKIVSIYTESLGEPGSGADTYIGFMRANVNAIVASLK
jgi:zinc/manganese transport system substrate-binding protein/manganese/iron transport system substrate-binding protein